MTPEFSHDFSHEFRLRVYYEDTDLAGIVYYANYLRFIERARSEAVASVGIDQSVLRDEGIVFAVRAVSAEYLASATLGNDLLVQTRFERMGGASLDLKQDVFLGDKMIFSSVVTLVCVKLGKGAMAWPKAVRERLQGFFDYV